MGSSPAWAAARIASWNVKHLGWQNNKDLNAVAAVIHRFDLVALQEVMYPAAVRRLAAEVEKRSGEPWGVLTSQPIGDNSYKESYAFIWRKSQVAFQGGSTVYLDPGNLFAREPLSARFTIQNNGQPMTIVAATVHITYGDHKSDRTAEIRALDEYWRWLGETFDGHRLLMGDFNMEPNEAAWREFNVLAQPLIKRGASTLSPRDGRYANLYDSIWADPSFRVTSSGVARYPQWLGLSHRDARRRVSDHAPVYITIGDARVSNRRVAE